MGIAALEAQILRRYLSSSVCGTSPRLARVGGRLMIREFVIDVVVKYRDAASISSKRRVICEYGLL